MSDYEDDSASLLRMTRPRCDGNHGGPPCQDPECWAREDGAGIVAEIPPVKVLLLPNEAAYVARLVAADLQRMIHAMDHGVSHGMRGYAPPDLESAMRVSHTLEMARTSAAIDAIEAIEEQRGDSAP